MLRAPAQVEERGPAEKDWGAGERTEQRLEVCKERDRVGDRVATAELCTGGSEPDEPSAWASRSERRRRERRARRPVQGLARDQVGDARNVDDEQVCGELGGAVRERIGHVGRDGVSAARAACKGEDEVEERDRPVRRAQGDREARRRFHLAHDLAEDRLACKRKCR